MRNLRFVNILVLASTFAVLNISLSAKELKAVASDEIIYEEGALSADEIDMEKYLKRYENRSITITPYSKSMSSYFDSSFFGSSCDLSESIYFPSIGFQRGGSCTSWASTYYQFTYEANKLNNINTKENNNMAYSPVWTFNFLNSGVDTGATLHDAYDFLSEHGALRIADCGYSDDLYNWSTKTDKMIEALNTRISKDEAIRLSSFKASENLDEIKSMLYGTDGTDGKLLAFSTCNRWVKSDEKHIGKNLDTDEIVSVSYRCYRGGGHSMVIVGYNDNIWVDINGNGEIEENEKGAFKVANSWGNNSDNNGFLWVSYDALNATTSVYGDWEQELINAREIEINNNNNLKKEEKETQINNYKNRVPAFYWYDDNYNTMYWIEVENKTPMYVGQLKIDTDYRNSLLINAARNISDNIDNYKGKFKQYNDIIKIPKNNEYEWVDAKTYPISYKGTLVFDYDDLCEPISDYINGYNWFVNVEGNHNSLYFKITDNLSNTIVDFGDITIKDSKPINLSMGDLDYNGIVDVNDSKILFNSIYNDKKLSNLQEYLASNMNKNFSIHAAITPSGYDDIGKVLDNLNAGNIAWDSVPSDVSLQTLVDGNYDVLFINCAEDVETNGEVIKSFVEQGGTVYASDWALDALIEAFPERNITYTTANPQNITANITDRGLITSTGLDTIPINFNLPDWRLINSMLQDDVTTYINGSVAASNDTFPLVFSFPYGNNGGKVFYTSFHHEANMTDEMQDVLNDLILTINHNKDINDLNEWMQINQYYSIMHNVGIADANMSSKSYVLDKLENSKEFAVITDEAGNFSIELTSPDGNVYTNYKNGEFLSGLVSDPSDNVQVYSLGKRGLRISNPDNLSNENNHWSYRVISHLPYTSSFVTGVAEKNEKTVLDYIIDYKVTQDWGVGQNIEITITNIGDRPIRNWALQCDNFFGTVTNVWNGKLQGDNIIRNDIHNSDIASGSSITMGYTLTNATGEVPEFTLCSFRNAKNDGYSVDFDVLSEWGEGFIGNITITNTTDTPIMAWELNFTAENFIIASTSQFEILKNVGNNYTITGTYNGNIPIPAYSSITLQFNGEKTGNPSISDILMTEMIIQE